MLPFCYFGAAALLAAAFRNNTITKKLKKTQY